nr:universal stress protein [Petrachloros mirabilis]
MIALDTQDLSDRVMAVVNTLNLQPRMKVVLAHVISPSESGLEKPADRPYIDPELGLFRHIEQQLQAYQDALPCQSEIEIVTGDPSEEIIRLANLYQAELIVLGSRGLTGVERILRGSVSSQVVSDARCSVLVVKPEYDG